MLRKILLLAALCLATLLAAFTPTVQAACRPCECLTCGEFPDSCCYAVGQGNVTCSYWASQNCPR